MKNLYLLGFISSCLLGIMIFIKLSKEDVLSKLILSLIPLSLLSILSTFVTKLLLLAGDTWSQNRLAATFALVNGYKKINEQDTNPVLTWTYGPLAQIAFLPITIFSDPQFALLAAGVLNIIYFFIPIAFVCLAKPLWFKRKQLVGWGGIIFCLVSALVIIFSKPLNYSAFRVGPDAPSLCFAGLSVCIIYYRYLFKNNSNYLLLLSAVLAVMSLWTKQNLIFLPFILIFYVFLAEGWRVCFKYIVSFLVATTLISIPLVLYFDWNYLYFVMFYFPSSYPSWNGENNSVLKSILSPGENLPFLKSTILDLITSIMPPVIIISLFAIYNFLIYKNAHATTISQKGKLNHFLRNQLFILPLFVAVFLIPIAFASKFKAGGDINSFSVAEYFLYLSIAIAFIDLVIKSKPYDPPEKNSLRQNTRKLVKLEKTLVLSTIIILILIKPNPIDFYKSIPIQLNNYERSILELQQAFIFSKDYSSNKIFFPDFPLASLMAHQKLHHSLKGLADRKEGRIQIELDHFKRYIPPDFQYIAFGLKSAINASFFQQNRVKYYLELLRKIDIQLIPEEHHELPGWIVYRRQSNA